MPSFDYHFRVKAPLRSVADFHCRASALQALTPPPVFVQFHKVEPLSEGSRSEFTMWFGPLPSRWRAVHFNVDPLHGFSDRQIRGPLKSWRHVHRFSPEGESVTRIDEHVELEHNDKAWGIFTRIAFSAPMLWLLFTYRQFVTRAALEKLRSR